MQQQNVTASGTRHQLSVQSKSSPYPNYPITLIHPAPRTGEGLIRRDTPPKSEDTSVTSFEILGFHMFHESHTFHMSRAGAVHTFLTVFVRLKTNRLEQHDTHLDEDENDY